MAAFNGLPNNHANAATKALEVMKVNNQRLLEQYRLELRKTDLEINFKSSHDSWLHRKECQQLLESKCLKVFLTSLGQSCRAVIKDFLNCEKISSRLDSFGKELFD